MNTKTASIILALGLASGASAHAALPGLTVECRAKGSDPALKGPSFELKVSEVKINPHFGTESPQKSYVGRGTLTLKEWDFAKFVWNDKVLKTPSPDRRFEVNFEVDKRNGSLIYVAAHWSKAGTHGTHFFYTNESHPNYKGDATGFNSDAEKLVTPTGKEIVKTGQLIEIEADHCLVSTGL